MAVPTVGITFKTIVLGCFSLEEKTITGSDHEELRNHIRASYQQYHIFVVICPRTKLNKCQSAPELLFLILDLG